VPTALRRKYIRPRKSRVPTMKDPVMSLNIPIKKAMMRASTENRMIFPLR
jgi:hypothetical protein